MRFNSGSLIFHIFFLLHTAATAAERYILVNHF
nr:MAG TPA: hypothetical protein [Caudoviricetes sp.]DAX29964.1 MAG TPA: hypothetical protein [Caudoviricetes sp.]